MHVYRLCREEFIADVLGGLGGLVADGRWHPMGYRIVYTASTEALSLLELRVHLGRFLPKVAHRMHRIEVPDALIARHDPAARRQSLPPRWNAVPHERPAQQWGSWWLERRDSAAIAVPSVHTRDDFNVLINPSHPQTTGRVTVLDSWPVAFDPRLFTSSGSGRLR